MSVATASLFFALLTVSANLAVLGAVALGVASLVSARAAEARRSLVARLEGSALPLAWLVATVATLGSLYYSEVAHFEPCKLCWYQRIAMYPLVFVLGVAALGRDHSVRRYVLPLVTVGAAISTYHYALERFPELGTGGCSVTVPCTVVWVWEFGYISIPFMALSAFAFIAVLLLARASRAPGARALARRSRP